LENGALTLCYLIEARVCRARAIIPIRKEENKEEGTKEKQKKKPPKEDRVNTISL
jgi:hypothetical protein